MAIAIDPSNLPGDYIERARAMTSFLAIALCERPSGHELPPLASEGLYHILNHIEDNLEMALSKI